MNYTNTLSEKRLINFLRHVKRVVILAVKFINKGLDAGKTFEQILDDEPDGFDIGVQKNLLIIIKFLLIVCQPLVLMSVIRMERL